MDALRQIDSEDVKFSIGTSDSAAIIEPLEQRESEEFLMLLMPVRLT
jgi:DNA polymerase III sliding clamp (beta) subunit (PCNA family)